MRHSRIFVRQVVIPNMVVTAETNSVVFTSNDDDSTTHQAIRLKLPLVVPVAVAQRTVIAVAQRLTLLLKSNSSISNDSNLI